MIKVDKSFYEHGFTMDGKGNRVFLKTKNGKVKKEMVFVKDKVIIIELQAFGAIEWTVDFKKINEIYAGVSSFETKPYLGIDIKR